MPLKPYNYYSLHQQVLSGELCSGGEHALCHHGHLALQLPTAHAHHQHQHHSAHQHAHKSGSSSGADAHAASVTADSSAAAAAAPSAPSPSPSDTNSTGSSHHCGGPYQPHVLAEEAGRLPHNYWGTPAFLHTLNARPELLLPQAIATGTV